MTLSSSVTFMVYSSIGLEKRPLVVTYTFSKITKDGPVLFYKQSMRLSLKGGSSLWPWS